MSFHDTFFFALSYKASVYSTLNNRTIYNTRFFFIWVNSLVLIILDASIPNQLCRQTEDNFIELVNSSIGTPPPR